MNPTSLQGGLRPQRHLAAIGVTLALAAGICMSRPAFAGFFDADCHALKLQSASGVPQANVHQYKFVGTCNILFVKSTGPVVLKTIPAVAAAKWDGATLQLTESFKVMGSVQYGGADEGNTHYNGGTIHPGVVASTFRCNSDPLVSSASCIMIQHSNPTGYAPFSNPAKKQSRPLLKGKTTLAEAEALSKKNAAVHPTPAPAPGPLKSLSKPVKPASRKTPAEPTAPAQERRVEPPPPVRRTR